MKTIDIERARLPSLLEKTGMIGIELGVASGDYSRSMVRSGLFSSVYGIDLYGDHHDIEEYKSALKFIGIDSPYRMLRMSFDDALDLFPDEYFDFVYIDGYAHTGENAGKTIFDWYAKVKIGGMIAGHDYHADWPLVIRAVDVFVERAGTELLATKLTVNPGPQDLHPSWAAIRTGKPVSFDDNIRALIFPEVVAADSVEQVVVDATGDLAVAPGPQRRSVAWRIARRVKRTFIFFLTGRPEIAKP